MYCRNCGTFIPENAETCPGCGMPNMQVGHTVYANEDMPPMQPETPFEQPYTTPMQPEAPPAQPYMPPAQPAAPVAPTASASPARWTCARCGHANAGNFCGECGAPRPS